MPNAANRGMALFVACSVLLKPAICRYKNEKTEIPSGQEIEMGIGTRREPMI